MDRVEAWGIVKAYEGGALAAEVSEMGNQEFADYEEALRIRAGLDDDIANQMPFVAMMSVTVCAVVFFAYYLVFAFLLRLPLIPGVVAAVAAGIACAAVLTVGTRRRVQDGMTFGETGLYDDGFDDKVAEALEAYDGDTDFGTVAGDALRQVRYAIRRRDEASALADEIHSDDAVARDRIKSVTAIECDGVRRSAASVAKVVAEQREERVTARGRDAEWDRTGLDGVREMLSRNYEFLLGDLDHILFHLELAKRGLSVGDKEKRAEVEALSAEMGMERYGTLVSDFHRKVPDLLSEAEAIGEETLSRGGSEGTDGDGSDGGLGISSLIVTRKDVPETAGSGKDGADDAAAQTGDSVADDSDPVAEEAASEAVANDAAEDIEKPVEEVVAEDVAETGEEAAPEVIEDVETAEETGDEETAESDGEVVAEPDESAETPSKGVSEVAGEAAAEDGGNDASE